MFNGDDVGGGYSALWGKDVRLCTLFTMARNAHLLKCCYSAIAPSVFTVTSCYS